MKRIIALVTAGTIFAMSSLAYATSAGTLYTSAAGGDVQANETSPATTPKSIAKMSTNVTLEVFWGTTAFAATTYHKSGNRQFGASNADTKISYKEIGVGVSMTDLTKSDSSDFSSWASL